MHKTETLWPPTRNNNIIIKSCLEFLAIFRWEDISTRSSQPVLRRATYRCAIARCRLRLSAFPPVSLWLLVGVVEDFWLLWLYVVPVAIKLA